MASMPQCSAKGAGKRFEPMSDRYRLAPTAGEGMAMAGRTGSRIGRGRGAIALMSMAVLAAPSAAQTPAAPPAAPTRPPYAWPVTMTNAQVLPADIGSERLRGTMVAFTAALGVRCSFCHVGGDEISLAERDFASDANPKKNIARAMMRMTWQLNRDTLPAIQGITQTQVSCYSCHRGAVTPALRPASATPPPAVPPPTQ
jgi:Photosynthetic reaction centre cytochrome C subunit